MEKKYILTIDRGQTNIKTALCSLQAEVSLVVSVDCPPIVSLKPGWAEQDMDAIWKVAAKGVRQLIRTSEIRPEEIAAISFSGQGGGNFLVDKEGNPVQSGLLSLDSRHLEAKHLFEDETYDKIPKTILVMRWLKEYEPEKYNRVRWILGSKDWIRFKLTKAAFADMSDTAAPVDFKSRAYSLDILREAGVEECIEMLPPIKYACEFCGSVTAEAAKECGLLEGIPVVAGAHDMISCSVGAGGNHQGHLAIILGTLGINIAVIDQECQIPEEPSKGEWFLFAGAEESLRTMTSSIGSGCRTLDWALDTFFPELKEIADEREISVYELAEEMLLDCDETSLIFLPYLMGTFYNSSAKASWIGITAKTAKEEMLLSILQGIAVSMCVEIERLKKITGNLDEIWIVGGGSKNKVWGQMFSDILKCRVFVSSVSEIGCRGAAICAMLGLDPNKKLADIPKPPVKTIYTPNIKKKFYYEKQLELFKEAISANENIWRAQN